MAVKSKTKAPKTRARAHPIHPDSGPLSVLTLRRPSAHGGYGWMRDLPDARDYLYAAPLARFPQGLSPSVDLRSECPPIYDQGQLGCCTGNGIAGAIEFDQRKPGDKEFTPSRLFIYYSGIPRSFGNRLTEFSGIDSTRLVKTNRNFLSAADRADLVAIARDGLEENCVSRRANAILLLDRGWSFAAIAEALFIDDLTIRIWVKEFQEGGVEALVLFDLKGGTGRLSPLQIDELRAWATRVLPTSTTEIGQFILERFGFDYGRSGLIKLMNRIGFDWKKPESVPDRIDAETQQKFIDAHEDLRNSLGPDEAVVYVDAVHPTHQAKPAGRWLPRGQRCALPAASGRDRLNLHGAIDLETGQTRIMDVQTVDAASTIALFEALERANSTMSRIHVFLDNARYHHARAVRGWLQQPGRRIVLHFVPSYCPHLNPIERLWKVMHENVTHNRCYAKFRDFAEAVLGFLRETVPSRFDEFSSSITDNFRVINPKDFRILA